jgi:hypothetical protein
MAVCILKYSKLASVRFRRSPTLEKKAFKSSMLACLARKLGINNNPNFNLFGLQDTVRKKAGAILAIFQNFPFLVQFRLSAWYEAQNQF